MSVPFLDLSRQSPQLREEIRQAVEEVLESQRFILGPPVERLERELATLCRVSHAVGVASGTDALLLGLQALGVGPGDEVVTTPFSFFATASCVVRLGARPIFADIDDATFTMDPQALARAATSKVKALLPVHLFGQCADVEGLSAAAEVAAGRRLAVVEDAAQAIGARRHGAPAGSLGRVGCFSFYPTKNLGGAGDGGMIVTDEESLARVIRLLRGHGDSGRYHHTDLGINSRLDSLQAAILLVKLGRLEAWNEARRKLAARYGRSLTDIGSGDLILPRTAPGNLHTYHQYVVRSGRRDELRRHLEAAGIGAAVYYPTPLHLQPCFASLGYRAGDFPKAEAACREVLALPIYPELTESEQDRVAETVAAFYRRG